MELEIITHEKTKLEAAMRGENHTFANFTHVVSAAYKVGHPLLDKERPVLFLETDGKESPKEALAKAARRIKEQTNEFGAKF
ncbi:MAG: DNA-directed RNA polymerase subunit L [Theionarchaea archaeon]|nr:DNA-directed RNA polymerase subunit L [Theionarchaea archaeon]